MAPVLIGREHPAGILRSEIDRAARSHGGLVLVTGEAGIGKTTLVTDAAEEARRRGALVLSGSCWDSGGAPGYWPWVQVLRGLRRGTTVEQWAAIEQAAGSGLPVLLGESAGTGVADGFQVYDAVTTALVSISQSRPVVVVLDDLHWADVASLKLLEFAAQHTWFERLLLVGTYRDVEVETTEHALRPQMMSLVAKARTVTLTGLRPGEVARLMVSTVGDEPDDELVAEVHRRTGGNPFFVEQTARLWHGGGSVTTIAPGVRDAVRRRLSLLSGPVARLLSDASVLGREFHRQVLAATAELPVAHVDRLLEQAVAARLMVSLGAGRFAFAHDLVRETLHDSLDDAEARARHASVVRALDRSAALAERIFPADLASHAYLAGDELEPGRAAELLLAAARDAGRRMAFEESIGHYRRALEVTKPDDPRKRVLIGLELGLGLHHHGGNDDDGWAVLSDAAELARELDQPDLLARAALTVYQKGHRDDHGELKAELLREAHRKLVPQDSAATEDRSLQQLATDLTIHIGMIARRGGDDETLGFSLWMLHDTIGGPGAAAERAKLTEEWAAVARRTSDAEAEQFATSLRWVALVEQGDPGYLEPLRAFVSMTERDGDTRMRIGALLDQGIIATFTGHFADAESYFERAMSLPGPDNNHIPFIVDHVRWALLLLQGRFDELAEVVRSLNERDYPFPHLLEAITAVHNGTVDPALRYLAEVPVEDEPFPRSFMPLWLRFQAQAAAASRDPELCERARAALLPHTGQWLVSLSGCDISGPVVHWLAVLDAAQQRWDDAIEKFGVARTSADLLGARPWSIEARAGLADALLARGSTGDESTAFTLLDELAREADEIGMRHIADRVRRVRSTMDTEEHPHDNEFRLTGDVWSLRMDGRTVHLPDTKGLRDIHYLLTRPGVDIPVVRLLNPEGGDVVVAAGKLGGDSVLDEEAKSRYKQRLTVLDDEIERATQRGDDDRAASLDREREALLHELRAAAGLAGRPRRLGDESERARKTVTARIRDTLRKLDDRHPSLAAYLRATVATGASCRYQPDEGISWRL
ncbi:MAG: AAA family ATPase [Pseudonocardiaceae bacterium]|nr:AAA family ATPase [Pseudonocardiaceae bacterium]